MDIAIRRASVEEAGTVAALVAALQTPMRGVEHNVPVLTEIAADLLQDDRYVALLAEVAGGAPVGAPGEAVGLLTLNECAAVYAEGRFGEIAELYVRPQLRSAGVGARLVAAARAHAAARGWRRLEVGAPHEQDWPRTIAFYRAQGFQIIGPRLSLPLMPFRGIVLPR